MGMTSLIIEAALVARSHVSVLREKIDENSTAAVKSDRMGIVEETGMRGAIAAKALLVALQSGCSCSQGSSA